jgi:flagellar motor switch protein FliG
MNSKNQEHLQNMEMRPAQGPQDEGIKVDGLQQVIELLKYADPAFRESLLKRLTSRDPQLAKSLRKIIS